MVTDYNDDLMYHFFALQHAFHRCLFDVLATHVTVCVCSHAESKGNFLPSLLIYLLTSLQPFGILIAASVHLRLKVVGPRGGA